MRRPPPGGAGDRPRRGVLTHPRTLRKFPALTLEAAVAFVDDLARVAVTLADVPKLFTLPRDPKDEPYVNLALAARAHYLVSRDNDLLDLMADEGFRRQYPDLTVVDPVTLLRALAMGTGLSPEQGPEAEGPG